MISRSPLGVLYLLATTALGSIVENVQDLPGLTYDFIVVGGNSSLIIISYHNALRQDADILVLNRWHCWQRYRQPFDGERWLLSPGP